MFPWVTIVLISFIAALAAFIAGFCFGAKNTSEEFERKLNHDRERYKQATDRFHESISQLNRTVNILMARTVRHSSDGSSEAEEALQELDAAVAKGTFPPISWEAYSDYNPRNWGQYVSHPDEHGYITPFGLTTSKQVAKKWQYIATLILGLPETKYIKRSRKPMTRNSEPLDLEL